MQSLINDKQFVGRAVEASIKIAAIFVMASWCYQILNPFVAPMVWAGIIAVAIKPICDWLEAKMGGRRGAAATVITLVLLSVLIIPAVQLGGGMIESAQRLSIQLEEGTLDVPAPDPKVAQWPFIGERTYKFWNMASDDIEATLQTYKPQISELSKTIATKVAGVGASLLMFIFSIIIAGVFLAGASGVESFIHRLARRMAGEKGDQFAGIASLTVRNVTQGILGVALLQAALAGLGFWMIGLPAVPLLAMLVLIMSIIQVNPILLLLPLAIYVYSFASPVVATVYLVWSIVVGLMDNVLKPLIMGKGSSVPMMVVFLGAIGGFITMGFVGLFVGAVIVVLGYVMFIEWLKMGEAAEEDATADQQ